MVSLHIDLRTAYRLLSFVLVAISLNLTTLLLIALDYAYASGLHMLKPLRNSSILICKPFMTVISARLGRKIEGTGQQLIVETLIRGDIT